jgi:hypothetical protein
MPSDLSRQKPDDERRLVVDGPEFDKADIIDRTSPVVRLKDEGAGVERLADASLSVQIEGNAADRPAKESMHMPLLVILAVITWAQRDRHHREFAEPAAA